MKMLYRLSFFMRRVILCTWWRRPRIFWFTWEGISYVVRRKYFNIIFINGIVSPSLNSWFGVLGCLSVKMSLLLINKLRHTCSSSLHLLLRAKYFLLSRALLSLSSFAVFSGSSLLPGPSSTWRIGICLVKCLKCFKMLSVYTWSNVKSLSLLCKQYLSDYYFFNNEKCHL